MPRSLFLVITTVLQIIMVTAGHFSPIVLGLSALLGVGIPLLVGAVYGAAAALSFKSAATGGFVLGIAPAAIGVLLAIALGDQTWILLTFAPLSSGIAGMLGALALFAVAGRRKLRAAHG